LKAHAAANARIARRLALFVGVMLIAAPAFAADEDPSAPVVLALAVILASAKLGGHLASRVGQPAVLGELLVGVLLGNLGVGWVEAIKADVNVDVLARIGVVILLFEVGLESTVRDMLKVGWTSLVVAVLGVVTPFALGWGVGLLLLPDQGPYVHAFLGATLTATSVGITARVLRDLRKSQSAEARVILGAAVIDDVLGLVILAVVGGIIAAANQGGALSWVEISAILAKSLGFLFSALALGVWLSPKLFRLTSRLSGSGVLLATALVFCFALAWLSSRLGLAPIVGAYAAGLILEDAHFRNFDARGERKLEELVQPISAFLVPVFFVLMGMHVDLTAFARVEVFGLAALLTLAAILGKQACSLGAGKELDRLSIGIGMIPRGEVGLIFANVGLGLSVQGRRVIDPETFSAVVIMVIVTTMATPPALRWSLSRHTETR
jgi:Kef-type K+ transport system membrane component KefB